ncbi:Aluminum-activated malate transporter protein [Dioscorea alata]|uniref:Aluminum-activated malate transporter protein n=1 Tax=Dioscorea alata TaxID=55571 RepID=A0ACB7WU79_DIOAL|nr:Aluminum-activated malate transporter protein [Dioscorea alata]
MVGVSEANNGVEWRVTVSEGSSVKIEHGTGFLSRAWLGLAGFLLAMKMKLLGFASKVWNIGADDPRKVIHGVKVGLALSLVSLFYYTRPLYDGVGGTAIWAVMTVVVVFEFSVGGCLCKGFNRATATLTGGTLALGFHYLADTSGKTFEPIIIGVSMFLLGSAATFSRFIPLIKDRFDYGITIFILTFSFVSVSGYRVEHLVTMAQQRLSTIAIGVSICFCICIFICPVWAGGDLHFLIVRNMEKLATSLEGLVANYFDDDDEENENEKSPSKTCQQYKCVLNSKGAEDSLAKLAIWEPAHGLFSFKHPWQQYLKIGVALRRCAYCVETLNGCINSDIQAPQYVKKHLNEVCTKVSLEAAKVLKETANSIKSMTKSPCIDSMIEEMNISVEELHTALRTLPNKKVTSSSQGIETMSFIEALPIIPVTSLLIEISTRVEGVVDSVEELAELASFKTSEIEKHEQSNEEQGKVVTIEVQQV